MKSSTVQCALEHYFEIVELFARTVSHNMVTLFPSVPLRDSVSLTALLIPNHVTNLFLFIQTSSIVFFILSIAQLFQCFDVVALLHIKTINIPAF